MNGCRTFNLESYYHAFKRGMLGVRVGVLGFALIIGIGAIVVFLVRLRTGDEFHLPFLILYALAAIGGPFLVWAASIWLAVGPQELVIDGTGVRFRGQSGREWGLSWTDTHFLLILWDDRVNVSARRPKEPFLLEARIPSQGFSALVSPEAFDALIVASKSRGMQLRDEVMVPGTGFARRIVSVSPSG